MSDPPKPIPITAKQIISASNDLRKIFDLYFPQDLNQFHVAADSTLKTIQEVDRIFIERLKGPNGFQQQACYALMCKALTNIMASLELLRAGYFDNSLGVYRSVIEAYSTAILVSLDANIARDFRADRYKVQSSVDRLVKRTDTGLTKEFRDLSKKYHTELHRAAHPTAAAIQLQFSIHGQMMALSGMFDPGRVKDYKTQIRNMRHIVTKIEEFLTVRFIKPGTAFPSA